jgi:hypothetical protein
MSIPTQSARSEEDSCGVKFRQPEDRSLVSVSVGIGEEIAAPSAGAKPEDARSLAIDLAAISRFQKLTDAARIARIFLWKQKQKNLTVRCSDFEHRQKKKLRL